MRYPFFEPTLPTNSAEEPFFSPPRSAWKTKLLIYLQRHGISVEHTQKTLTAFLIYNISRKRGIAKRRLLDGNIVCAPRPALGSLTHYGSDVKRIAGVGSGDIGNWRESPAHFGGHGRLPASG